MPSTLMRPCLVSRCPNLTRTARCPQHTPTQSQGERDYDRSRGSASQRGYGARWRRLRAMQLNAHPLCVVCGRAATDVDHIISRRKGGTDVEDNLQSMCHQHHSEKTNREDGGGWQRR